VRHRLAEALLQAERGIGAIPQASLSCAINGLLPGAEALRDRLAAISQAHGLPDEDDSAIEEGCGRFMAEALEQHLRRILGHALLDDGQETAFLDTLDSPSLANALISVGVLPT
jgi:hypothetical protein